MNKKILLLLQGPVYNATLVDYIARNCETMRAAFGGDVYVCAAIWSSDIPRYGDKIARLVDKVCIVERGIEVGGASNRRLHRKAVSAAIDECNGLGINYCLKLRIDWCMSLEFACLLKRRIDCGFNKILVTNLFTRLEPFHLSDCCVFADYSIIRDIFGVGEFYYEDVFSPEVEFTRTLIRRRGWGYPFTLNAWIKFLRERVEIVAYDKSKFTWLKFVNRFGAVGYNRHFRMNYDRGLGPISAKVIPVFLWRMFVACPWLDLFFVFLIQFMDCLLSAFFYLVDPHGKYLWGAYANDGVVFEFNKK